MAPLWCHLEASLSADADRGQRRWTRPDGGAFDPWLRTHLRMGAQILRVCLASQIFTGTVHQWEQWCGLDLPGDGDYLVPRALAPVKIDHAADTDTCVESTIWVHHR